MKEKEGAGVGEEDKRSILGLKERNPSLVERKVLLSSTPDHQHNCGGEGGEQPRQQPQESLLQENGRRCKNGLHYSSGSLCHPNWYINSQRCPQYHSCPTTCLLLTVRGKHKTWLGLVSCLEGS